MTPDEIKALSQTPKRTRTDEGTVEERPIEEVIAADRYASAVNAAARPPFGLHFARISPPSTTGRNNE